MRIGRIYAQSFTDANAVVAFSKLYLSKLSMTAVDLLYGRGLSAEDAQGVALERALWDNGRVYFGRPLRHPFELYYTVQQIKHRTAKIRSPETYGMVERFHCMRKDEFFSFAYCQN